MTHQLTPRASHYSPKFPNAIRRYRVQVGLSQKRLATVLGLHRASVSLWERGLRKPTPTSLRRMAVELRTKPDALYEPTPTAVSPDGVLTDASA